jgi:isopenicillin N synthase-like dioxygenase
VLAPARIPVVELGEAMDPRSPHGAEVAHDLGQALDHCGALYLVGHGVSDDLLVNQLELARLLFARESGGWRRVRRDDGAAGEPPDRFDLLSSQALLLGEHDGLDFAEQVPEALAAATAAYMLALARVSRRLLQLLALSLDGPPQALLPPHGRAWQTLRLLRYPPAEGVDAGARAHVDHGALTLLAQDHHLGLELQDACGGWAPALPRPGALLVHAGEALQRASGGRYRALVHRVRRSALQREERVSLACFYTPLPP